MTEFAATSRRRILIVDDEQVIAMDMEMQLLNFGFDVVGIAASSNEALRQVKATNPDLVLLDVKLKGPVDGFATANEIRSVAAIPVIFVTAFAGAEARIHAEASSRLSYLIKPFRPQDLLGAINKALEPGCGSKAANG